MPDYMLLLRGTYHVERRLSPAELAAMMGRFTGWIRELGARGQFRGGDPFQQEGRLVASGGGPTVADGPFLETKDAVGGYLILAAETLDAATALAVDCPLVQAGAGVEVRPIKLMAP
jgi:hypothetical protein